MDAGTMMRAAAVTGGVGAAACLGTWLAAGPEKAPRRDPGPGADHRPVVARRQHDLAVAWWPQDMAAIGVGAARALTFQTLVANVGTGDARVGGARVAYSLHPLDRAGRPGPALSRGWAPLDRLDTTSFPPPFSAGSGHASSSFGQQLRDTTQLAPDTAGIIGSRQPSQRLSLGDARDGVYVLRQSIEPGAGAADDDAANDVRDTTFELRGSTIVQLASAYAPDPTAGAGS